MPITLEEAKEGLEVLVTGCLSCDLCITDVACGCHFKSTRSVGVIKEIKINVSYYVRLDDHPEVITVAFHQGGSEDFYLAELDLVDPLLQRIGET